MLKEEAMARLHEVLKPGDTVHTILRHVARSGMHRRISLVKVKEDGEIFELDGLCVEIGLAKRKTVKRYGPSSSWNSYEEGLVASGCGMDMGFNLVYNLGRMMWPDGTPEPHGSRNGAPDSEGGYALKHRWL